MSESVSDHVKGTCSFAFYRDGNLFYTTNDTKMTFPVPVAEVQGASCMAQEKSVFFMRWIRPYILQRNMPKGNADNYYD